MKRRRFGRGPFDFSWNGPSFLLRVECGRFMIAVAHSRKAMEKRRQARQARREGDGS
jgi:hypothetical protein